MEPTAALAFGGSGSSPSGNNAITNVELGMGLHGLKLVILNTARQQLWGVDKYNSKFSVWWLDLTK